MGNREIKFRAILKRESIFREVHSIDFLNLKVQVSISGSLEWHDYKVLVQYTGLLDKNGKEIYEGDIVKCRMSFEGGSLPHMGEITYLKQFGAFATKNLSPCEGTLLHNHILNTFEVIGNIYENPELLNEQGGDG